MTTLYEIASRIVAGDLPAPPVAELVSLTMTVIEPGHAVMEMEAGPQHANPMGTVHGGIITTLADSAMGMAYAATTRDGESFTTLELKVNSLKPVWSGRLTAEARLIKGGASVGLVKCGVTDAGGNLVAHATSTCMTLRGDRAAGR